MTNSYIDPSDISSRIGALQSGMKFNAVSNAAGVTLTAAQMLGGCLDRSGAVTVSDTTPTAAQLVAALAGAAVGDAKLLKLRNRNTGTLTLLAGAGITLEGTTTIPTVNTRNYAIRVTNATPGAEAVTISGIGVMAN